MEGKRHKCSNVVLLEMLYYALQILTKANKTISGGRRVNVLNSEFIHWREGCYAGAITRIGGRWENKQITFPWSGPKLFLFPM